MNKVKFGLKNVSYALATIDSETGVYSYGTPALIPGAVDLALSPEGDTAEFFADDLLYFSRANNQGYSGDLEIAIVPEAFLTDIMGMEEDDNGALIENATQVPLPFALGFQVDGDTTGKKVWLYNCTCARPEDGSGTKDKGITPVTEKLSLIVAPRLSDSQVKASMVLNDTNSVAYAAFFTAVYEEVNATA